MNFVFDYTHIALPEDIEKYRAAGRFSEERAAISRHIPTAFPALRARLIAEHRAAGLLEQEYPLSRQDALRLLSASIPDINDGKLQKLIDEGYVDWIFVNEKQRFRESIYRTLVAGGSPYTPLEGADEEFDALLAEMTSRGSAKRRYTVKSSLTVTAPLDAGTPLRVHLPFVKPTENISEIRLLSCSPRLSDLADEDAPQRTAYFVSDSAREFSVEYSFESESVYKRLMPALAVEKEYDFDIYEQPSHILFTPLICALAGEIVKDERNPLVKARLIYDYITKSVRYSFMRPYLTVPNLAEYAILNGRGDCGVQALLFITLCRCVGIPARWESGRAISGGSANMHDWAKFYVKPFGWLHADCSRGGVALRGNNMNKWEFYFGNIDPARIVFATEFRRDFMPKKEFIAADPTDNQCGEAETDKRGLYREDYETETSVLSTEVL